MVAFWVAVAVPFPLAKAAVVVEVPVYDKGPILKSKVTSVLFSSTAWCDEYAFAHIRQGLYVGEMERRPLPMEEVSFEEEDDDSSEEELNAFEEEGRGVFTIAEGVADALVAAWLPEGSAQAEKEVVPPDDEDCWLHSNPEQARPGVCARPPQQAQDEVGPYVMTALEQQSEVLSAELHPSFRTGEVF